MLATISAKGQITIPKSIREILGVDKGDRVDFIIERGDVKLRPAQKDRAKILAGSLRKYAVEEYSQKKVREETKRMVAVDAAKEGIPD